MRRHTRPPWTLLLAVPLCLLLLAFSGTRTKRGPGKPLDPGALLSVYGHWFDSPYEYMFDRGTPRLTVKGRAFGDLRPMEQLSGLKIYTRRSQTGRDFSRFNPNIVRWGYRNLIPDPGARLLGHRCQKIYDKLFARFFRLMAVSHLHLERGALWKQETRAYLRAMKRRRFDGIDYLQQRFTGALPALDLAQDGTRFTAPMALGFWIRRRIDGTADELWTGLALLLGRYDARWLARQRRQQTLAAPAAPTKKKKKRDVITR